MLAPRAGLEPAT